MSGENDLVRVTAAQQCCSNPWEEAYVRFETAEEEITKFMRRLQKLGADEWDKNVRVVELFCGRGNGLHALSRVGFRNVEGVDLSETLIARYSGPAKCYVCDCRRLPFENSSRDRVIVQGGLHHLPRFPGDMNQTLGEIRRVLRPDGLTVIIEPFPTAFLDIVHKMCQVALFRRCWPKLDALATMIENERVTYDQWLVQPVAILAALTSYFPRHVAHVAWGKLHFVGSPFLEPDIPIRRRQNSIFARRKCLRRC